MIARCRNELKTALGAIDRATMLAQEIKEAAGCARVELRLVSRDNPDAWFVLVEAAWIDAQIVIADQGEDQFIAGMAGDQ